MSDPTPERWLPVPGYEGFYEVSDLGRVRGVDRWVRTKGGVKHLWRGKLLKAAPGRGGYMRVSLCKDGKVNGRFVHALVLEAFTGPRPQPLPGHSRIEGRHLDGDPGNNAAANLAWGTMQENWEDSRRHGRRHNGTKTHCPQGHPYTPENTYVITLRRTGEKQRRCKTCVKQRQKLHRLKIANAS